MMNSNEQIEISLGFRRSFDRQFCSDLLLSKKTPEPRLTPPPFLTSYHVVCKQNNNLFLKKRIFIANYFEGVGIV